MMKDWSLRVSRRVTALREAGVIGRLWDGDTTLWPGDPALIRNRLGWLRLPEAAPRLAASLPPRLGAPAAGIDRVILAGMGGSSMTPLVAGAILPAPPGSPTLTVLDTTDPREVAEALAPGLSRTLLVVASKSGTTTEPLALRDVIHEAFRAEGIDPASRTVVITDPGTPLASSPAAAVIESPGDVGGRFSALSPFGLVPLVLAGRDVAGMAAAAAAAGLDCRRDDDANPALILGALLGETALAGCDKLVLEDRFPVAAAGLWIEQLVAESLGKKGKGVIPVTRPSPAASLLSFPDIVLVRGGAPGDVPAPDAALPFWHLGIDAPAGLGRLFVVWELAVAIAGHIIGVDPFDEPDVTLAKTLSGEAIARLAGGSPLSAVLPAADSPADARRGLEEMTPGDYAALLLYLPDRPDYRRAAADFRDRIETALARPVVVQFGPRYLHSTGQAFKGGPAGGTFLVVSAPPTPPVPLPGRPFSLGDLQIAQAAGDHRALRERGREAFWLPLPDPSAGALRRLLMSLG